MNYRVIWGHAIVNDLTEIYLWVWENGRDTGAVTAAVAEIDNLLQANPATRGESQAGEERILFALPLSVTFEVYEEERIIFVSAVRYHTRG